MTASVSKQSCKLIFLGSTKPMTHIKELQETLGSHTQVRCRELQRIHHECHHGAVETRLDNPKMRNATCQPKTNVWNLQNMSNWLCRQWNHPKSSKTYPIMLTLWYNGLSCCLQRWHHVSEHQCMSPGSSASYPAACRYTQRRTRSWPKHLSPI